MQPTYVIHSYLTSFTLPTINMSGAVVQDQNSVLCYIIPCLVTNGNGRLVFERLLRLIDFSTLLYPIIVAFDLNNSASAIWDVEIHFSGWIRISQLCKAAMKDIVTLPSHLNMPIPTGANHKPSFLICLFVFSMTLYRYD